MEVNGDMAAISKLGIGPMSEEVVEAVFRYSEKFNTPLMLIASKNQVDWDGGYVNNWTTKQYAEYVSSLKTKYPKAKVYVCRDHCGPGFKNPDLEDVYKTIDADLESNFDLIHVDFCHFPGTREQIFQESKKAIEYIKKQNANVLLEVGTDENTGELLSDSGRIEKELYFFSNVAPIHFFVVQSGSLIKEVNQVGTFNKSFLEKLKPIFSRYNIHLKEHNADYIDAEQILERNGVIDAVNVAPQYGVLQTKLTLQKAMTYGIDFSDFLNDAYESKKWKKWLHKNNEQNKLLCSIIAGHYTFTSDSYRKLYEKICKHENLRETIISEMMKNFDLYIKNFS